MKEEHKEELEGQLDSELEKLRANGYEEAAESIEEFDAVELLDDGLISDIKQDFPEAINLIYSMQAGLKALKEELEKNEAEGSEATEETEAELEVEDFLNESTSKKVRLSGYLDDETYFHVLFPQKGNEVKPVAVTSDGKMNLIKNKKQELKKKDKKYSPKKHDYQYFSYEGEEHQFKHKIASYPELDIYRPDNSALHYLKEEQPSKQVYKDVEKKVRKYWDHFDEEWFDVVTAWIVHTYLINGLGYTVYLMPKGKENTGKSTLQKLVARLSYNGFFSGKNTSAASSRIAHHMQATLNLDEFEKSAGKDIEGVFNTGQRKGAKYTFTNMNKKKVDEQIEALYSFCPKTLSVNTTHQFDKHFLSRNIILEATRTEKNLENIETMSESEQKEFQEIRNHLLAYTLFNHKEVLESISKYKQKLDKSGRKADKIAAVCGIIEHFRDDESSVASEVADFIESSEELQEEQLNQKIEVLFEEIIGKFDENTERVKVSPKKLAEKVNQTLEIEEEYKISPRGVGNRLRNYDVLRENWQSKRSGPKGGTRYTITREYLEDSLNRYELDDLKEKLAGTQNSGSASSGPSANSVDNKLKELGGRKEAVALHDLIVESDYGEEVVKEIVQRRKDEGIYYEPSPGHLRILA